MEDSEQKPTNISFLQVFDILAKVGWQWPSAIGNVNVRLTILYERSSRIPPWEPSDPPVSAIVLLSFGC